MDVDAILQAVHRSYQGDTDYPSSGDDDYSLRLGFLQDEVRSWGNQGSEENIEWKELFTTLTDAATGDKVATANDNDYSCPTDFVHLTSWVTITDGNNAKQYYEVIEPNRVVEKTKNDSSGNWCYITGNENDGYTLHINSPVAGTINYNYYKTPYIPTSGSHKPEMRRPYYIVHGILSKLFELDGRNDLVTFHEQKKKGISDSMLIENELVPFGNSNVVGDLQNTTNGVAWGE